MQLLVPLYELRPYDESDPRWSPLLFTGSITGNAATTVVGTPKGPPPNKAWIITGCYLANDPAGVSIALNNEVRINSDAAVPVRLQTLFQVKEPTGQLAGGETVAGSGMVNAVIIGDVHKLNAVWQVDVGNAANVFLWGFHGYEVPRGNVALR